jgi:hypothetical protein
MQPEQLNPWNIVYMYFIFMQMISAAGAKKAALAPAGLVERRPRECVERGLVGQDVGLRRIEKWACCKSTGNRNGEDGQSTYLNG